MAADSPSPAERIAAAFTKLAESAKGINLVSDELAKPIASLEAALKRLNVGVACWVEISGHIDGHRFFRTELGHARVDGVWSIAVRSTEGTEQAPDESREEMWRFNEAPRYLRIKAVDKLPDLIEALVDTAEAAAKRMTQKIAPAHELADAVIALSAKRR